MYKNIFLVHVSYSIFRFLFDWRNVSHNMLGPPLLNSKLDLGTAKCLRKLIRTPLKLLTQIELHTLSNFSFSVKAKKKNTSHDTEKSVPKDRNISVLGAQLFIHIPHGLNKRQEFNSRTVFTTLENRKVLNCRILAANLKPFFHDVFILFLSFFLFIFCNCCVFCSLSWCLGVLLRDSVLCLNYSWHFKVFQHSFSEMSMFFNRLKNDFILVWSLQTFHQ